jgi:hypothetical protein
MDQIIDPPSSIEVARASRAVRRMLDISGIAGTGLGVANPAECFAVHDARPLNQKMAALTTSPISRPADR